MGQVAITSTVLLTSVSSTLLLQMVTFPYVAYLYELSPQDATNSVSDQYSPRRFRAVRYNFLGCHQVVEFSLDEVDKKVSNPFASFRVTSKGNAAANGNYYVFAGGLEDSDLRTALCKSE